MIIGSGEFAAEANVPKDSPHACKMDVDLGFCRQKRAVRGDQGENDQEVVLERKVVKVLVKKIREFFNLFSALEGISIWNILMNDVEATFLLLKSEASLFPCDRSGSE